MYFSVFVTIAESGERNEKDGSLIWEISGATPGPKIYRKEVLGRRDFNRCHHKFILVVVGCNIVLYACVPDLQRDQTDSWNPPNRTWTGPRTLTYSVLTHLSHEKLLRECVPPFWQIGRHERGVTKVIITGDEAPDRNAISQEWMARSSIMWERGNCGGRKNDESCTLAKRAVNENWYP